MPAPIDITGQRFGRLVAIEWMKESTKNHGRVWRCICDCGKETLTNSGSLRSGNTTSCGCWQKEAVKTHGLSRTPEWNSWAGAKERCLNPNNKDYGRYGAKGIEFFKDWENNFPLFLEHVGFKPNDGKVYSLGRIDNTKGYIPFNVKWETSEQQARNRSPSARNTTGIVGISLQERTIKGVTYKYYVASWQTGACQQETAYFSIGKLGEEEALRRAVAKRELEMAKAEVNGVVFAETHGKPKGILMNE